MADDVYGLGAVLFEALSGEQPHHERTEGATIDHLLTRAPRRLETLRPSLPIGLARVVHRALAFDAWYRYTTMEDLAAALAPYSRRRPSHEQGVRHDKPGARAGGPEADHQRVLGVRRSDVHGVLAS